VTLRVESVFIEGIFNLRHKLFYSSCRSYVHISFHPDEALILEDSCPSGFGYFDSCFVQSGDKVSSVFEVGSENIKRGNFFIYRKGLAVSVVNYASSFIRSIFAFSLRACYLGEKVAFNNLKEKKTPRDYHPENNRKINEESYPAFFTEH